MTANYKKPEYGNWLAMRRRCYDENFSSYKRYGAKGIQVCDRWRNSFENFLQDMGERPADKTTIDRINPNGDYEPSNCRWADWYQQNSNKRKTTFGGVDYHKPKKKWRSRITQNGKRILLGYFPTKIDAESAVRQHWLTLNKQ